MYDAVGTLEEEAFRRKERLRELAKQTLGKKDTSYINDGNSLPSGIPKPVFRSYQTECTEIKKGAIDGIGVGDVQKEVIAQLEMMKTPIIIEDIDIVNLAPRKPDWDLKRDVSRKFEKLDRRTQKAIAELIRERLKEGQCNDILQTVNVASASASIADKGSES